MWFAVAILFVENEISVNTHRHTKHNLDIPFTSYSKSDLCHT